MKFKFHCLHWLQVFGLFRTPWTGFGILLHVLNCFGLFWIAAKGHKRWPIRVTWKTLQLRIITCCVGIQGFWIPVPLNLNWSFLNFWNCLLDSVVILVQGVCVHTYAVAGFWSLCQLWVLELSWEEFSTLATGVHDPAYLQLEQLPLGCGASTTLSYQDVSWRMLSYQDV